jgi:exodeoxyribonuclease VII small subunit
MRDAIQPENMPVEELSFEDAFAKLEATVHCLEQGELTLDEAIALYEQGMALALRCGKVLDSAELRVEQLTTQEGYPA